MPRFLYVIPARGGSKGIPGKNIRMLGPKPLVMHAVDLARSLASDDDVCLSSDSEEIIGVVRKAGLEVPFKRPYDLATDTAGTREVLLHALQFYRDRGREYDAVVLLQPTSPFRRERHVRDCLDLFRDDLDMVVSVTRAGSGNPYYDLFEETDKGYLEISKPAEFARRQDCPAVYRLNGAVYVINRRSVEQAPLSRFKKVLKYGMDPVYSLDLDTPLDWLIAELLLTQPVFDGEYIFPTDKA